MTKTIPFKHQQIGIEALIKNPFFALFDECGAGKSKQVIDAACTLAEQGKIDTVIVLCPASVRCVWIDPEIGEISKHAWVPSAVYEYHSKVKRIWENATIRWENGTKGLHWFITNYEFLRNAKRFEGLIQIIKNQKALLVCDESSYVKNRTAAQTKATLRLRQYCARCIILNGTPVVQSPMDLWSQMEILSPEILKREYKNFYGFRYAYAEMATDHARGRTFQKVVRYKNLDRLSKKLAPYVLRRLKADCLDLPPKLYTQREVPLTPESWARYCELKRDLLVTLGNGDKQIEPNAAVRLMRLAQLTSGILGGVLGVPEYDEQCISVINTNVKNISEEKLSWAVQYLNEECTAKAVIVWTRWRRERERLYEELLSYNHPMKIATFQLFGGQLKLSREEAVQAFSENANRYDERRKILIAQPHAGGFGLNLVAATEAIYLSNDFSLGIRLQSEDRCHRPGQQHSVLYTDVIAVGPKGESTIDRTIFKALLDKQDIANWTTQHWRKELESDE